MREVILAKSAGFCYGVRRAVEMAQREAERGSSCVMLGSIIHNSHVVDYLARRGIRQIDRPEEAPAGASVLIRSHGESRTVYQTLEEQGNPVLDATCPNVAHIHKLVAEAERKGRIPVIIGAPNHPEVLAIAGWCDQPVVLEGVESLQKWLEEDPSRREKPLTFVSQTTSTREIWENSVNFAKKVCTNLEIFDTICNATQVRQTEASQIAAESDFMVVIGDRHSSNTGKLFDICKRQCENTVLIETAAELDLNKVSVAESIGVTAGASTPARIIKEVLDTMSEVKSGETNFEPSFEEMLEESLKNFNTNERVMGTVLSIAPNEVQVDVGRKQTGFIPASELSNDPNARPEDVVKVGDVIELLIMKTNDQEGTIMLSKRRVDAQKGWEELKEKAESQEVLSGKVTEAVKGGVIVLYNGSRIFIPASQATATREESLEDLVGQNVDFRLIEVSQNGRRRRAIGSIRSVLKEQRAAQREEFWKTCEVGKRYKGVVKSLTSYGAFVDLGGVFGMIHISELSWTHIKHPSEVVNVGDTVDVYIKDINEETKKISLGFKNAEDNPWEILKNNYPEGTVVKATIVGLTTFGAFANIIPGIDGLIHISQIANKRIEKPADVLKVGDVVEAKITAIDFDKKRVSLSMRALLPEDEQAPAKSEEAAE